MALGQNLEQRQTQSLVMTPQLQQLLKLVQMTNLELNAHVDAELESNPLLEKTRETAETEPLDDQPWNGPSSIGTPGSRDGFDAINLIAQTTSLTEHLSTQIMLGDGEDNIRAIAILLVGELQDDGYLRCDLDEFADRHRLSDIDVALALNLLQACEPTGIGARSLKECLWLQLAEDDALNTDIEALLSVLPEVSSADPARLSEKIGVSEPRLTSLLARLRSLDPKPGLKFTGGTMQLAVPDVFVRADPQGGWRIELNTENLPRVLVNNQYAAHINTLKDEEKAYISECRTRASWLVKAMEQRARTILSVANEIVKQQAAFFAGGVVDLKPLMQKDVALKLQIHESTVSRAAAGKYISCKQGNFPMQFFFSQAIATSDGKEAVSSRAVKEQIRRIIGGEDPKKTLSDDKIVKILKDTGLTLARRTVTKYREALNLPSSVQRKRMNALKKR